MEQKRHNSSSSKRRSRRRRIQRRRRMQVLFSLLLFCSILVLAVSYMFFQRFVSRYPADKFCGNVFIGSFDVSGMTKKEVEKMMEEHLSSGRQASVVMQVGEKEESATLEELGLGYKDLKRQIKTAFDYGKTGSLWQRFWKLKKLSGEKKVFKENYTLSKKQVKELEQVAKMVEKCCGYSVANEKPDNPVKWLEEGRRRIGCSAVIDRRVEAYFAGCFRDFYFEKQIWVKQEKDKGRPWKALYSEMYKAVEKWHYRWMHIMTVAKAVRESENGEYRNTYSLCKIAMEGVQEEAFIGKTITNSIKKDLWQEWCEKLVDEILSHKLRQNYEEDYNYMLIRAFLELNDIHDKIAKEQQKYCPELQEIIPKPSSESSLGTFYEAIFRQYK